MSVTLRLIWTATLVTAAAFTPSPVASQAFGLPEGVGAVTLAGQYVDNTGHRNTDGRLVERGESVTSSAFLEVDYGVTSRLSASIGLPYVFARYTGALPSFSRLPVDECRCWHSGIQDLTVAARYRFGNETWALTPMLRYSRPSHDYAFQGEAVVGRNLDELQVGLGAGLRLGRMLPQASLQANYAYSIVEKAVDDVSVNRSNGSLEVGYAIRRLVFLRASGLWQRTHGGLRAGSVSGIPFGLPGELNTPERFAQRDRLGRVNYFHLGGGLAYTAGPVDVFAGITRFMSGTDTHDGQAYNLGATWYFDRSK